MLPRFLAPAIIAYLMLSSIGCSSLGLSCYPTGHYLTKQAEAVLQSSPRRAQVPRELEQAVVPVHYLQPGDVLLIEPVDFNSDVRIPADQQVLIDGSVDLGGFGRVVVTGLSIEMAEQLIERTIVDAGHPITKVNVRLLEPVDRFYVLGEVNSPGSYPLEGNETVLDGLLAAGGLTSAAAPCKILLARPTLPSSCRVTLPICYREITQMGDTTTNYQLQPGDRVFVASRTWAEELMFWHATKPCSRCCDCQSACVDPSVIGYLNPVTQAAGGSLLANPQVDEATGSLHGASVSQATLGVRVEDELAAAGETLSPNRLPSASDGELDFGPAKSSERFEPLWIKPAPNQDVLTPNP